jgi:hypothetical protein
MADAGYQDAAVVARSAAAIVSRLDQRMAEVTGSIQQMLVTEIADLRGDAQLLQLLRDSVDGNVATVFSAIRHAIPIEKVELPTAALEHARRLAQRGVTVNALVRAYRLGHKAVLDAVLDEIRESDLEPPLSLAVFRQISEITFGYIDWITQQVIGTYQSERDLWMENRNSLRALRVRELLDEADVDIDSVTTAIRYPLRRIHVSVVAWCDDHDDGDEDLASMERFVQQLAESTGTHESSLFISVDRLTAWAWIPCRQTPRRTPLLGFARSPRREPTLLGSRLVTRCRASRASGVRISRRKTLARSRCVGLERAPGHRLRRSRPFDRGAAGRQRRRGAGVGHRGARATRVLHGQRRATSRHAASLPAQRLKLQGRRRGTAPPLQLGQISGAARNRTARPTDRRRPAGHRNRVASLSLVWECRAHHSGLMAADKLTRVRGLNSVVRQPQDFEPVRRSRASMTVGQTSMS